MAISKIVTNSVDSGVTLTSPVMNTITSAAATALTLQSAGTTAITVDTSQNVGIGTTSPATFAGAKFTVSGAQPQMAIAGTASTAGQLYILSNGSAATASGFLIGQGYNTASDSVAYISNQASADMIFRTAAAERMRINSSGNVLVGGTTQAISSRVSIESTSTKLILRDTNATAGKFWRFDADVNNSVLIYNQNNAGVWIGDGGTAWNSSSDETLKTDLVSIKDAAIKVSTLRAVTGRFKTDEIGVSRSFLIAQDVKKVLPEAVAISPTGTLGLAYTDVIPLLVAAIQEQQALILALTTRIAALEAK